MKINDFKKLEENIKNQDFNKSYKNINVVMFVLSIFGHISSIFLAYFLISKILSGAIVNNDIIVTVSSIILLSGLELLKRDLFDKLSLQYIKFKNLVSKEVLPLLIFSLLIISTSFYASIKGAKEFSSKSKQIETQMVNNVKVYEDSLTTINNIKITNIEQEIKSIKSKIDDKDKEQTSIESTPPLSLQQRNRVKDLKLEKSSLKEDISKYDGDIVNLKSELSLKIKSFEENAKISTIQVKGENETNSFFFIIISTLIEFIILTGVYFNKYFKFRSYSDFKTKIDRDPNYQKWSLYNSMLDIIYTDDTKLNDKLISSKNIIDLCKVNGIILLPKDMVSFFKVLTSLNIIKTSGSSRYISKSKDLSIEILKSHFKIE
jgi:hypothetical protein